MPGKFGTIVRPFRCANVQDSTTQTWAPLLGAGACLGLGVLSTIVAAKYLRS